MRILMYIAINTAFASAFVLPQMTPRRMSCRSKNAIPEPILMSKVDFTDNDDDINVDKSSIPSSDSFQRRSFLQSAFLTPAMALIPSFQKAAFAEDGKFVDEDTGSPVKVVSPAEVLSSAEGSSISTLESASEVVASSSESSGPELVLYKDLQCGFEVSVPVTWEKSVQSLSDRRKIVFFIDPKSANEAEEDDRTLFFIAYTPVRDDFTSLSSFGSVEQVGQMTILPKGEIAGVNNAESVMISSESKKNAYFFDYTVKVQGQPKRHFRTVYALIPGATGGAGSMLVTLSAQTLESRYDAYKDIFDQIVNSYQKLKMI